MPYTKSSTYSRQPELLDKREDISEEETEAPLLTTYTEEDLKELNRREALLNKSNALNASRQ